MYSGNPDLWAGLFPDDLVAEIIDLVLDSWDTFRKPSPDDLEVLISRRLCQQLRASKNRSRLPFSIDVESEELGKEPGELLGRIDLRMRHGYEETVYFALECKRLNSVAEGKRSSLAAPYVEKGMARFVSGQYAGGLDKGGMLGYVMDGQLEDAISSVKEAVESRRKALKMDRNATLTLSSVRPHQKQVRETNHRQGQRPFLMHHLFLPAC